MIRSPFCGSPSSRRWSMCESSAHAAWGTFTGASREGGCFRGGRKPPNAQSMGLFFGSYTAYRSANISTWHDFMWHDVKWRDVTWHGMVWYTILWYDMTGQDTTRHDTAWRGMLWSVTSTYYPMPYYIIIFIFTFILPPLTLLILCIIIFSLILPYLSLSHIISSYPILRPTRTGPAAEGHLVHDHLPAAQAVPAVGESATQHNATAASYWIWSKYQYIIVTINNYCKQT